jgi:chloramphenicol-sensitive protein RarD
VTTTRRRLGGPAAGVLFAAAAYTLWGFLPLYFLLLAPAGPFEVVAFRVLCSLVFCAILVAVTRTWGRLRVVLRSPRTLLLIGLGGLLLYVNWQVFLIAVLGGDVLQGALGYFINPIVTVLLGVILLRERARPAQWIAIGISAAAVAVLVVGYGGVPWIALALALSFGGYGLVKKRIGGTVDAITGLTFETAWLVPLAVVELVVVGLTTGISFTVHGPAHAILMLSSGVVTALPLLFFAAAARRLSLVALGLSQYLTPVLQFLTGVLLLHERMPPERWIGFGLVWVALLVLTIDVVVASRRRGPAASVSSSEPR